MHELGIVFHIADSVVQVAKDNGAARVHSVTLEVGEVSTVIPEHLLDVWKWNCKRNPMLEDCEDTPVRKQQEATRGILDRLPIGKLDLTDFDRNHMLEIFHSDKWAALSESCLGCGSCTFVCPCQCYDVEEFNTGREIKRFRCWDSCMYSDFTQMSAGQPRPTQKERFRQRFMHKLVYFPSNNDGVFGCVGCGRCLQKCPIHMNIVKVAKALKEERK